MPYGLLVNGNLQELGDIKYLLSPQDLMAVEHLPQLIQVPIPTLNFSNACEWPHISLFWSDS